MDVVETGTGSMPGLGPKRTGRHSPASKAPYILMKERMRTFVVPEGLNESLVSHFYPICRLRKRLMETMIVTTICFTRCQNRP